MAEKYTRGKLGLNDFYMKYVHYKGFNLRMAEAYAGLYKMLGGQKEVMEVKPATYWFLGVQERMHLVYLEVRNKELKFKKELEDLKYSKLSNEIEEAEKKLTDEFRREISEYMYNKMFMPSLFSLKNYFNIEYKIISKTLTGIHFEIYKSDGTLFLKDRLDLAYSYLFGEMNKVLNRIFIYFNTDFSSNDASHIMNNLCLEFSNTDKRIKNWFFPNPRNKYNIL
jgi:hypothetical protein